MKFKRIDVDTVRCLISEDELRENGLNVNDFINNDGKAENFLRRIISMAEQEVGYKVQGGNISIHVAVLPENVVALTFSEKPEQTIVNMLDELKAAVKRLMQAAEGAASAETAQTGKQEPAARTEEKSGTVAENMAMQSKSSYQLHFLELDSVIAYARGIQPECEIRSSLYYIEKENSYYLIIEKGKMNDKQVCRLLSASLDFAYEIYAHAPIKAYLYEHGKCIIKEHAIERLQEL